MKKKRNILLTILCVILVLALAVTAAGAIYIKHMLGKIQRVEPEAQVIATQPQLQDTAPAQTPQTQQTEPSQAPETAPAQTQQTEPAQTQQTEPAQTQQTEPAQPQETEPAQSPEIIVPKEHILNFLLIGQDRRANQGRQRSDVMILCTVNKAQKQLTLTSLQRDMYVPIPGHGHSRLNAAYQLGGMALLEATLLENFGLTLDGMVEVDFSGFTNIIDLLGGVNITLTQEEAEALKLSAGAQVLNGKYALEYARLRSIDSDFHRTNRQRTIITSLLKQNRDMSLSRVHQVLGACLGLLITNMNDSQLIQYAAELFPLLKDLTVESGSIPAINDYVSATIGGRDVLIPDMEKIRQQLRQIMEAD